MSVPQQLHHWITVVAVGTMAPLLLALPIFAQHYSRTDLTAAPTSPRAVLARSSIMQIRTLLTVLYFFLTIYSFSAGAVQGIANYSAWKFIGAEDFPVVHQSISRRILLVYVPFFFLSVVVNITLIWLHHPVVSTSLVATSAILNLFIWIVTATLAIPIHKQLDRAKSAELIDRLVAVHLYLRLIPGVIVMIITAAMMVQTFRVARG